MTNLRIDQLVVVIATAAFEGSLAFYRDVIGMELIETDRPWGGRGFVVRDPNGVAVNIYTSYDR